MRWMVVAGAVWASLAQAAVAGDWQRRDADVRAADGQRVLYRESHFVRTQGTPERWVAYRCPDGRAFARKRVAGGGQAPAFALEDARGAYAEGVRGKGSTRTAYLRKGGKTDDRSVTVPANGVIDAGFDAAVRAQWDALMAGKSVGMQFLLPSRQRFYPVEVKRTSATTWHGVRAERLRMQLDSWFGFAVPDVQLVYARDDRRLLEFTGTGNIRDAQGDFPRVRIGFSAQPAAASAADVAAMRNEPLNGSCRF